jgi:soluble lytic murein transglycosylase-like protein
LLRPLLLSATALVLAAALAGCGSGGMLPPGPAGGSLPQMVAAASVQSRVPERLTYAIVKAESDGDATARSASGAMGLMQIMPQTARAYRVADPFDPWQNLLGGTRYLHDLLRRYHGNVKLAVAAYNAGPRAVDRYRGIPPFHETRSYVSRVLGDFGS